MAEKKLKKLSKKSGAKSGSKSNKTNKKREKPVSAKAVLDSANQIWLAGLGAFAKAQNEGEKIFETLVKEGSKIDKKTRKSTEARVEEVRGAFQETIGQVQSKANESWDKLERVFEDRVARALNGLGVPTSNDIKDLTKRVDELQKAVRELNSKKSAKKAPTRKKAAKKKASKRVAKKTTKKKTLKKKTAKKK